MGDQDIVSLQEVMIDILREIDPGVIRRGFVNIRSNFWISPPHPNALNAIKGVKAEKLLRTCPLVRSALSNYFGKPIREIQDVPGRKKSDHHIIFEDGTRQNVQQKNGTGGGRGWSFDRRPLCHMPLTDSANGLLRTVCLDRSNGWRSTVQLELALLDSLLLGDDEQMEPHYFIHTMTDKDGITSLSISPADVFVKTIKDDAYPHLKSKRTCVHLTPLVYLQRKGGGKTDHSPDDIQAKITRCPDCMETLTLS